MRYILLSALLIMGCSQAGKETKPISVNIDSINGANIELEKVPQIVVIEGCQYFKCQQYGFDNYTLTHKGNCNNPIHNQLINK